MAKGLGNSLLAYRTDDHLGIYFITLLSFQSRINRWRDSDLRSPSMGLIVSISYKLHSFVFGRNVVTKPGKFIRQPLKTLGIGGVVGNYEYD